MREEYSRRRALMRGYLEALPKLRFSEAEGGFYFFVDASAWKLDAQTLALKLLEHGGVVTTPGDYYGPAGRGHLRLSFASHPEAISRGMQSFVRVLNELA
jgi:aspartate/methionine/tyrosine aminotransferase